MKKVPNQKILFFISSLHSTSLHYWNHIENRSSFKIFVEFLDNTQVLTNCGFIRKRYDYVALAFIDEYLKNIFDYLREHILEALKCWSMKCWSSAYLRLLWFTTFSSSFQKKSIWHGKLQLTRCFSFFGIITRIIEEIYLERRCNGLVVRALGR